MRRVRLAVALAAMVSIAGSASALTLEARGVVVEADPLLVDFAVGDPFIYRVRYDAEAADADSGDVERGVFLGATQVLDIGAQRWVNAESELVQTPGRLRVTTEIGEGRFPADAPTTTLRSEQPLGLSDIGFSVILRDDMLLDADAVPGEIFTVPGARFRGDIRVSRDEVLAFEFDDVTVEDVGETRTVMALGRITEASSLYDRLQTGGAEVATAVGDAAALTLTIRLDQPDGDPEMGVGVFDIATARLDAGPFSFDLDSMTAETLASGDVSVLRVDSPDTVTSRTEVFSLAETSPSVLDSITSAAFDIVTVNTPLDTAAALDGAMRVGLRFGGSSGPFVEGRAERIVVLGAAVIPAPPALLLLLGAMAAMAFQRRAVVARR